MGWGKDVSLELFCGGVAGSISKTLASPLERVKILFQVHHKEYPYRGILPTLRLIYQREGFYGYYKGNFASIIRVFPYAAIQFTVFDMVQPHMPGPPAIRQFCSGAIAGVMAVLVTYPLDVTRARLTAQVSERYYQGIFSTLCKMYQQEGGMRALWRGGGPTLMGIIPYAGINFVTFHSLKRRYVQQHGGEIPTTTLLGYGAIAGLVGQTITYPIDVVRRQMQLDGMKLCQPYRISYQSTYQGIQHIFQEHGWRGLFRGLQINYIKVVPLVSVSFTTNEWLKRKMGIRARRSSG